jgi:hypothetical protein
MSAIDQNVVYVVHDCIHISACHGFTEKCTLFVPWDYSLTLRPNDKLLASYMPTPMVWWKFQGKAMLRRFITKGSYYG